MNWNYIRDGFNPRGAAYGAAERAAAAAQTTAEVQQDMLELKLASSEQERSRIAARIAARRQGQAHRCAWWQRLDLAASAALIIGGIWFFEAPASNAPQSAVTRDTPAGASKVVDNDNAPVRAVRALYTDNSAMAAIVAQLNAAAPEAREVALNAGEAAAAAAAHGSTYADASPETKAAVEAAAVAAIKATIMECNQDK